MQNCGIAALVGHNEFNRITIGHPDKPLAKEHVSALVDDIITSKSLTKMGMKPYLVSAGSTRTKANWVENSRRAFGHEQKTFTIPIFLYCFERGIIACRLAQHKPKAILREVGAQQNEFSKIKCSKQGSDSIASFMSSNAACAAGVQ